MQAFDPQRTTHVDFEDLPEEITVWDRSVMKLNTQQWRVRANIRNSIRRPLQQFRAYQPNSDTIAIVGGGWSLDQTFEELRDLHFSGVKLVGVNGATKWLVSKNLRPSMHIQLDPRPDNVDFILPNDVPGMKYMIASQSHPAVFDALEGRDVTIFHVISTDGEQERDRLNYHYAGRWQEVPSSGTVGIVAIMVCRMLGFEFQHIFGMDSCYSPEVLPDGTHRHHAYAQERNNKEGAAEFWIAGRRFMCSAWQAAQCGEFVELLKRYGDAVQLAIHGDGALAHILRAGYETQPQPETTET